MILSAIIGALGLVVVSLIGLWGAKKLHIGESQDRLVATLKDLIEAQNQKIEEMEQERAEDRERITKLEKRVVELEDLTVSQALELKRFRESAKGAGP